MVQKKSRLKKSTRLRFVKLSSFWELNTDAIGTGRDLRTRTEFLHQERLSV